MSDCDPVSFVAEWPAAPVSSTDTTGGGDTPPAPVACKSTLKEPEKTTCASFTKYTRIMAIGDGLILTGATVAHKELESKKPTLAKDIWGGCHTLYALIQGVNNEFIVAINDINAGTKFDPVEPPSDLPDWPSDPTEGNQVKAMLDGVWSVVSAALDLALPKVPDGPLKVAIAGLLKNGREALDSLAPLLEQAFGD